MKISKRHILPIIVLALVFAIMTPLVIGAVGHYAINVGYGEDCRDELSEYFESEADLMYDETFLEQSVNEETPAIQLGQVDVSERFMFQIEYYNVVALRLQKELLRRNIALAQRQLEVEHVRFNLGETTQSNVDLANVQLQAFVAQLELVYESFSLRAEIVDRKRGLPGFEFIGDYSLPNISTPNVTDLNTLISNLLSGDIMPEMATQIEMTATAQWIAYLDAKMQYDLAATMRPILMVRLDLIAELYALGEISYIEKLAHELEVYEELFSADMATITLAIAIAELNVLLEQM
ncbi:MAG: TolC family protein [Oscillospiraceae bacterium]|nr:TolC family protein [Oscillospiraceae bacterium]